MEPGLFGEMADCRTGAGNIQDECEGDVKEGGKERGREGRRKKMEERKEE